jgi:protein TonB
MFNSSLNVYKTEWLDLVFANRNKNYGAYQLRSKSSSIMTRSLLISGTVFILFCISPLVYSKLNPEEPVEMAKPIKIDDQTIFKMEDKKIEEKKDEIKKEEPVKVKTVNMPNRVEVTRDELATTPPPTITEIKDAVISNKTQDGEIKPDLVLTNDVSKGNGGGEKAVEGSDDGNAIINLPGVDEYPEFEGGMKAWAKYIQRNLRYPSMAQENGVMGKVFLSFVVEKDGSISNVSLVKGIGSGCDEEAIKVIKKSPAWKPGKNKGNPVRVRYNLPINFTLSN